ncbi:Similar to Rab18: Ras-related protein Rab-18 (Rattus norvegicus) [Cotesia congregata]|uniref:Similar to Rab18: Ras-related protein Rab-18 (Rattus norvegicus) n=1 Tax=Cotesia congregata TaxID=51543 RepID=A0A8J2MYT3_COTCN|nr:Similar to Rab18: Ras-related protein Rab-18 (Rattus norvegicus) [Cotesia congregata]
MTMDQEVLTTLKLLMIGESNVGKSSILLRFTEDEFNENIQNTVGMDYKTKQVNIDGNVVKLAIWVIFINKLFFFFIDPVINTKVSGRF